MFSKKFLKVNQTELLQYITLVLLKRKQVIA